MKPFMKGGISSKKLRQIFLRRSELLKIAGMKIEIEALRLKKELNQKSI